MNSVLHSTSPRHKSELHNSLEEELSLTIDNCNASYHVSDQQARKLQQYEDDIEKLRASEKVLQNKLSKAGTIQNSLQEQLQTTVKSSIDHVYGLCPTTPPPGAF